jgi:perosamine synthetase
MWLSGESMGIRRREPIAVGAFPAVAMAPAASGTETILEEQAWFTDEQVEFVLRNIPGVLLQGQSSNGPWTAELETTLARHARVQYAAAFPAGSTALAATLAALGVGPGDEVLLPAHSFAGNARAVRLAGAAPLFCDIAADTHCLQPEEIGRQATPRTKAVILVHTGGLITPDIAEILGRCQARGLHLIEDCSHALGATWLGRPAGSFGVAGVFRFHSTRVLTAGEGGAVVTNEQRLAAALREQQGRPADAARETAADAGHSNRFPEISALFGLAHYRSLPRLMAARNQTAAYYRARLCREAPQVGLQAHPQHIEHSYWKFLLNLPRGVSRDQVRLFLQRHGVPAGVCCEPPLHHEPTAHHEPAPADWGAAAATCPAAADVLARSLCLPTDPRMSESQRARVIDVFLEALKQSADPAS